MPAKNVRQHLTQLAVNDQENLRPLLEAIVDSLDAIEVDITALDTAFDTLVAKMNLDAGITDADYAGAAAMTFDASANITKV